MASLWTDLIAPVTDRELHGDGASRLMPTDDFATAPATGLVTSRAGGHALVVTYAWTHPTDGDQDGVLLCSAADEDTSALVGTWLDSWHQKPHPLQLAGSLDGSTAALAGVYAQTWGWQVDLTFAEGGLRVVMRNVIPEEAVAQAPPEMAGVEAGAYDVMDLRLG